MTSTQIKTAVNLFKKESKIQNKTIGYISISKAEFTKKVGCNFKDIIFCSDFSIIRGEVMLSGSFKA